jgi:AcrR family transcriptional regulator
LTLATRPTFQPRKMPVQARSSVTVDAILQATLQVLIGLGKERLTTTQVAHRAGVSVGTLYQYFPNKSALLKACLKRHMEGISEAILGVCREREGAGLLAMGNALVSAYLDAKMRDVKRSVALYAVSEGLEGMAMMKVESKRLQMAVAELVATAQEGITKDPEVVASVVLGAIAGVTRRVLEAKSPERAAGPLREELLVLVEAYLLTCASVAQA